MKRLALFSMLLSLSLFTIGCAPPAEEKADTPAPAAEGDGHEHAEGEEHSEGEMPAEEEAPVEEEAPAE